jgi:thioredoxin-like negative regulator of GroEL
MARVAQRFIPLRIDIDTNQDLVIKYGIKAIPAVVIITANGDIIWQRRDYTSANAHLKLLKAIPNDITTINKAIKPILQKDIQLQTLANLGKAYQHIGATIDNKKFKNRFFKLSNHYFKLAQKEKGSKEAKQELVLLSILNDVYKGNTKKAQKKLAKVKESNNKSHLKELKHFIRAYSYKYMGEEAALEKEKEQISNVDYLMQLEK